MTSFNIRGLRVTIPDPLGKKSLELKMLEDAIEKMQVVSSYLPTKLSKTLLLPELWAPTTTIWGRSKSNIQSESNLLFQILFSTNILQKLSTVVDIPLIYELMNWCR